MATVHSGYTGGRGRGKGGGKRNGKKITAAELAQVKLTNPCRRCGKVGHWDDAHNPDGSLKPRTPRFDPQVSSSYGNNQSGGTSNINNLNNNNSNQNGSGSHDNSSRPPIIGFMANLSQDTSEMSSPPNTLRYASSLSTRSSSIGPLVDDGSPYNAIGEAELRFHQKRLVGGKISFEIKPVELAQCDFWQFGDGNHSIPRRRILGSVVLYLVTDSTRLFQ